MELQERRELLIAALRSDQYEFGKRMLRRESLASQKCVFCFAGVMCEIYRLAHPESSRWIESKLIDSMMFEIDDKDAYTDSDMSSGDSYETLMRTIPPRQVVQYFGIAEFNDEAEKLDSSFITIYYLVNLNDDVDDFCPIIKILTKLWGYNSLEHKGD